MLTTITATMNCGRLSRIPPAPAPCVLGEVTSLLYTIAAYTAGIEDRIAQINYIILVLVINIG